jgi:hypothetical protein
MGNSTLTDPNEQPQEKPPEVTEEDFEKALAESPPDLTVDSESDDGLMYDPKPVRPVDPETES